MREGQASDAKSWSMRICLNASNASYQEVLCRGSPARRSRISAAGKKFSGESVSGWEIYGPLEGHGDHGFIPRSPHRCAGP